MSGYNVHIRDTTTGEERLYRYDYEGGCPPWNDGDEMGSGDWYQWGEGNYSCDCNRQLFFWRARPDLGEEDAAEEDEKCGDGRFVVRIVLDDGRVTIDEWTHGAGYWP